MNIYLGLCSRNCCFLAFSFLAVLFVTNVGQSEEDFNSLMLKVPASANAVVVIDAESLRNSPLGKKNKWEDKNEAAYVNTPFILPPEANRIIVASQLNPNEQFKQFWELAVMSLTDPVSMRAIARSEGGQLDSIAGIPAVETAGNVYFVELSKDLLGVMSPANRQLVARWATLFESPQDQNGYLAKAVSDVSESSQIVLAIDLKNAVVPHQLRAALADSEFVTEKKVDQEQWASAIETLLGVKLVIEVNDGIEGRLSVEFGGDPSALGKHSKDAIIGALQRFGVSFESIEDWSFSQSSHELKLEGDLSLADLRKIMSLLEVPSADLSNESSPASAPQTGDDQVAKASQKYFKSVSTLVKDIETDFKTNRDVRHNYSASYMQRYAQRIDDLPILNVDDDLINYGLMVSETLRDTSVVQGNANLQSGVRKSSVYQSTNSNYDYNYSYRSVSSMKTQIGREEQAVASGARFSNFKEIKDATANIRVQMTKKYGVEF